MRVLAAAAAGRDGSDSVQAIADALHRVTDLPVVVEDRSARPGPGRERVSRSLLMGAERTPSYCGKRNGTPHRSAIVTA
jgi:hypothetical protein